MPPGTNGPPTIQEQFETMTLLANVSGGVGDLTYAWTADLGEIDDPSLELPVWTVPEVVTDTTVTFTVTITDGVVSLPFESVAWLVFPAFELTEIQFESPAEAGFEFPVTLVREEDAGLPVRSFRFPDLPAGVTVDEECNGGNSTDFDDLEETCTFSFDAEGEFTLTVDLRDACAGETQGSPKPLITYEFTVVVDPAP